MPDTTRKLILNHRRGLTIINISKLTVMKKITALKSDKSPRPDEFHPRVLKEADMIRQETKGVSIDCCWRRHSARQGFADHCSVSEQTDPTETVNLVAIVILSRGKCGLSKCITFYLVAMAAADLTVLIIEVILKRINNIYLPVSFLFITPVCALKLVIKIAALDCSVWFTVAFTFDRFVYICRQNLKPKFCTQRTASLVVVTVCVLGCLRSIPFYFTNEPQLIINNVPYFCIATAAYNTSPLWAAYEWFDSILTPILPIFFILLFNALTVKHIIMSNIVRRALLRNVDNHNDPETENRKKSMILLFALSGNFILLWVTYVVHSLSWRVKNYYYTDKYYTNPIYINQQTGFMLQLLSSCTNTCIYGLTQRKFRAELKNGVKYLFTLNGKLCK